MTNALSRSTDEVANWKSLSITDLLMVAQHATDSNYFPSAMDVSQSFVKMMAGRELGVGPITSMRLLHFIDGQITLAAKLLASLVKDSARYDYRVKSMDNKSCRIEFFQRSPDGKSWESLGVSEYGEEDAKRQGIFDRGQNYKKIPRNMYWSRAMSNGVGWYVPDVTMGAAYTPEEMRPGEFDDEGNSLTGDDARVVAPKSITSPRKEKEEIPDAEVVSAEEAPDEAVKSLDEFKALPAIGQRKAIESLTKRHKATTSVTGYLAEAKVKNVGDLAKEQKADLYGKLLLRANVQAMSKQEK